MNIMIDTGHSLLKAAHPACDLPADNTRESIGRELGAWHATGLRIAIWWDAGESAAFLETHGVDAHRFPIVVDSDPASAGRFVAGTGQPIRSPGWLLENPVDIILIPCQWRAAAIVCEIDAAGIAYEGILIPHAGRLVDFQAADHPYHRRETVLA
jgi:hypothetical protein